MQIAEHFVNLADFLEATAKTLDQWAVESQRYGWSTHQVEANIALAHKCRVQAAECVRLAGHTVVT